jgi:probable HAF family extracellular repeat protein
MKSRLIGSFAIGLMAIAASSQAQTYTMADLGVLAGDNQSYAGGLNSAGQATGTSSTTSNSYSGLATLFSKGEAISLGSLAAGDESFGAAINANGQVTGYDYLGTRVGPSHAFLYSNGKMTDIDSPSLFPLGTAGLGINDSGEVAGYGWTTATNMHAFVYANGKMTALGTLGGSSAIALAINDLGQVVGWSLTAAGATHAFLYSNGKMTDLGMPSDASSASAIAITSNSEILGDLEVGTSTHVGVYSNGVWTDLGAGGVVGTVGTMANGINASGQIVGDATFPGIYSPRSARKPAINIGFIYRNGEWLDLNTLIPANSGFAIKAAFAINDAGQILCNATNKTSGQLHAALLTPK